MNVNVCELVEMVGIVSVPIPHDRVRDEGIYLDAGYVPAAIRDGAQHVNSSAWADDGEVAARAQYVSE